MSKKGIGMRKFDKLVINSIGRQVPCEVNGKAEIPYMGVGKYIPEGRIYSTPIVSCANFPSDGNKLIGSLKESLLKAGLKNGMTISTHHHFRNGDLIANMIFDIAKEIGAKDLIWFPSASFECNSYLIKYLDEEYHQPTLLFHTLARTVQIYLYVYIHKVCMSMYQNAVCKVISRVGSLSTLSSSHSHR